jgi:hypothetical protein
MAANDNKKATTLSTLWPMTALIIAQIPQIFLGRCYRRRLMMKYLLVLVMLLIPTAALAKGECKQEKKKLCAGLEKKELWTCLSEHEAELGNPCKTKLEAKAKKAAVKEKPASSAPSTAPSTQPPPPGGQPQ